MTVVATVCFLLVWFLPKFQVKDFSPGHANQKFLAENEARKTIAQIIGGLAILTGLYFTHATLLLTEAGQVTDRFSKATDELGNPSMAVRLGALVAFDRLARDSPADSWHVMRVLTAWLRATDPCRPSDREPKTDIAPDVQEALGILAYRDIRQDPRDEFLDLSGTDLRNANLYQAQFANMWFWNTCFDGADLTDADLHNSDLGGASFRGAILKGANVAAWNPASRLQTILEGSSGDADTEVPAGMTTPTWAVRNSR